MLGAGAAVGVLALLGAVRFGFGGQTNLRRAAPVRLVTNKRGVLLEPQEGSADGGDARVVDTITDYALLSSFNPLIL